MTHIHMDLPSILNATRLSSGARGYEGHVVTRQMVAHVLMYFKKYNYQAAYRLAKAARVATPYGVFTRGSIGGHTGWCIWLS